MYQRIHSKLLSLHPIVLKVDNVSHLHAHHEAMQNSLNTESHFSIMVVSNEFNNKRLLHRHKLIYTLLDKEMKEIHALQMKLLTEEEFNKKP